MAGITAEQVKELRDRTGAGIMDCKKMLVEADGNMDKAIELLESKTKDLPSREARQIKQMLSESTTEEIEHKFDKALASVQNELAKAEEDRSSALESEIDKIIKDDEAVKEDDLLKGRHHNAHVDEGDEESEEETDGEDEEVEEAEEEEEEVEDDEEVEEAEEEEADLTTDSEKNLTESLKAFVKNNSRLFG